MGAVLLVSFREVLEMALIVGTVLTGVSEMKRRDLVREVWLATGVGVVLSLLVMLGLSVVGGEVGSWLAEETEELFEGVMLVVTAGFLTWAVFWFHRMFGRNKLEFQDRMKQTVDRGVRWSLFGLVLVSVLREGLEIVLFLSTLYVTLSLGGLLMGVGLGAILAVGIAVACFRAVRGFPLYRVFAGIEILLLLFAGGMLKRGVHELIEFGVLGEWAERGEIMMRWLPSKNGVLGAMVDIFWGVEAELLLLELVVYVVFVGGLGWWLWGRRSQVQTATVKE